MRDIMGKGKSLEDSDLLIKAITQMKEHETIEKRDRFFGMMLSTLVVSLLENILAGKGVVKAADGEVRGFSESGF